jgi:hypothetical protein
MPGEATKMFVGVGGKSQHKDTVQALFSIGKTVMKIQLKII